ncbi:MAG: hypothetical protein ACOYYF_15740 [Chloroflexota bacterium]|nr:VCBS repeat-containing protein [Chloroflexota bacterium]MBI5704767.1 VCBS repeat-containing protein [Chloroflexota bacterium]
MKPLLTGLLIGIFFLTACGGTPLQTQTAPASVSNNLTSTPSPTPTRTLIPSATPTASITPLPTIPTFTPTFDVSTVVTVTPAPKAECPKQNPSLKLSFSFNDPNIKPEEKILEFLNNGGSTKTILGALPSFYYPHDVRLEDITGDGIPELMYVHNSGFRKFYIFTCSGGKYTLFTGNAESIFIEFYGVFDMNSNGLPELIVITRSCTGGGCYRYYILEWNGETYTDLISESDMWVEGVISEKVADTNNDGTLELVIRNVPPTWSVPWRVQVKTLSWNGKFFSTQSEEFDQPIYRFQAVQDGDLETLLGKYNTALNFYRQVIFQEDLEWWSVERKKYEQAVLDSSWYGTPTPSVDLSEDPTEYPRLAAYAYYRIMLLHLVQGQEAEASTTYNTLQQKFGNDPYARPYAEMATAFWKAYHSTQRMYDGCAAAIQYAVEHSEILTPLGSDYHGSQARIYKPEDVCPFR